MSSSKKRKRTSGKMQVVDFGTYRPSSRKKRRFTPGVDRTGGYYGRYSGRSGELKFFDLTMIDAVVDIAGSIKNTINDIPQGVTESTRVGRKCTIKSINMRYQTFLPVQDAGASPEAGDILRIICYLDKQCNGAAATQTDLLETNAWDSFRNLANSGRFVFLWDHLITQNYTGMASDGAGVVSQGTNTKAGTWYKKCDIPIEFNSTTGVIAEIRSNNIGFMLSSTNGNIGLNANIRIRFSDNY